MISTVAADLGNRTADTGLHVTTPGAPQIQALLAQMVANGLTHCVLEMTSHGLAQGRLNGVDLDLAVLTNVTHEHLDYHGSFEAYRAAKGRMFAMLGTSYRKPNAPKIAVINADDPNVDFFASFPADRVVSYGLSSVRELRASQASPLQSHYIATDIRYQPDATQFAVVGETVTAELETRLAGEFNLYNTLAAVTTSLALGVDADGIRQGIKAFGGIPGRLERVDEGQDFIAIVDFAHTPDALEKALTAGRQMLEPGQKLIAVFGSAGLRDREKRRLMSEVSARLADITILTAEDPRTESLDHILQVMAEACESQGGVEGQTFFRVPDRGAALYRACQLAQPGDLVMACGKGHEQSMCFGTVEYPWDDREPCARPCMARPSRRCRRPDRWQNVGRRRW
jgi:UDP-N-acetylmuramoyl-L-alanyl-D-glutamate--2,6-diaminopimelate ligase